MNVKLVHAMLLPPVLIYQELSNVLAILVSLEMVLLAMVCNFFYS